MGQNDNVKNNVSQKAGIETVDFCELITNPDSYEGKTVRTIAIYAYGGEDFTVLYCPQCYTKGTLRPYFSDLFETKTKAKIANKLSRQKQSGGTVKIVFVGKFHTHSFAIEYIETAKYISKEFNFPDRLSKKTKRKIKCEKKD
jgi:hypothetical protein